MLGQRGGRESGSEFPESCNGVATESRRAWEPRSRGGKSLLLAPGPPRRSAPSFQATRCRLCAHSNFGRHAFYHVHSTDGEGEAGGSWNCFTPFDPVRVQGLCLGGVNLSVCLSSPARPDPPGVGGCGGPHARSHPVGGSRSRGQAHGQQGGRALHAQWGVESGHHGTTGPSVPCTHGGWCPVSGSLTSLSPSSAAHLLWDLEDVVSSPWVSVSLSLCHWGE